MSIAEYKILICSYWNCKCKRENTSTNYLWFNANVGSKLNTGCDRNDSNISKRDWFELLLKKFYFLKIHIKKFLVLSFKNYGIVTNKNFIIFLI